ncbi:hypothetical protein ACFX11_020134 [Malus domestica]
MMIKQLPKLYPSCNFPSFCVYSKLFSSLPSVTSSSGVETQLRFLCGKSNPQVSEAVSGFLRVVDSNSLPSGAACNLLLHALTKSKNYELAFSGL